MAEANEPGSQRSNGSEACTQTLRGCVADLAMGRNDHCGRDKAVTPSSAVGQSAHSRAAGPREHVDVRGICIALL